MKPSLMVKKDGMILAPSTVRKISALEKRIEMGVKTIKVRLSKKEFLKNPFKP